MTLDGCSTDTLFILYPGKGHSRMFTSKHAWSSILNVVEWVGKVPSCRTFQCRETSVQSTMRQFRDCFYHRFQFVLLAFSGLFFVASGQAQQPPALVIEGGTLIDGNGGAPLQNAVVVMQGNKIAAVGRAGQTTYPSGSQVIKADGKFIVPGLWDNHTAPAWFMQEPFMN